MLIVNNLSHLINERDVNLDNKLDIEFWSLQEVVFEGGHEACFLVYIAGLRLWIQDCIKD